MIDRCPAPNTVRAPTARLFRMATDIIAERLLQIIDEGRRTATYKLALLTALMDACAENVDARGRAPQQLHTRDIAAHVLRLYLPQARLYLGGDGDPFELRQINTHRSAVLGAIVGLQLEAELTGCRSIGQIRDRLPAEYERCLNEVEYTFARYPIVRLQVVGAQQRPFLYDVDWTESVTHKQLHSPGGGEVRFRSGAGDELLRLAPLLRPLIELHWTTMVARINRIDTEYDRIHTHLFGAQRVTFPTSLRSGLAELQGGECFYCGDRLTKATQVDHFIPWSRWPNDAIENLVLADACNGHKRDHLAADVHVARWSSRLAGAVDDLHAIATTANWQSAAGRSLSMARSTYAHLPTGTPLWLRGGEFTDLNVATIVKALAGAA